MVNVIAQIYKWLGTKAASPTEKREGEPFFMYLSVVIGKIFFNIVLYTN